MHISSMPYSIDCIDEDDNELMFFRIKQRERESLPLWVVDAGMSCQGCNAMKDVPVVIRLEPKEYIDARTYIKEHCMDVVEIALKELDCKWYLYQGRK